jgi:hypothetical protein
VLHDWVEPEERNTTPTMIIIKAKNAITAVNDICISCRQAFIFGETVPQKTAALQQTMLDSKQLDMIIIRIVMMCGWFSLITLVGQ